MDSEEVNSFAFKNKSMTQCFPLNIDFYFQLTDVPKKKKKIVTLISILFY